MSVQEPAESSANGSKNLQVCDEPFGGAVSWAQLMEEDEQFNKITDDDDGETEEADGGETTENSSPERRGRRNIPTEPPFRVQITNISSQHVEEELIYYFGGESHIKRVDIRKEDGNAEFEYFTRDGLLLALKKQDVEFKGRVLKVFVRQNRESVARVTSRHSQQEYGRPYESNDSHFSGKSSSQNYRRSHYNSQNSLNSDKHGRYDKGNRSNHYGTMPAGGFHDRRGGGSYRGSNDCRFNNNGSFRAPRNPNYDRQNSSGRDDYHHGNGGPLQRSGSYQHNHNHSNTKDYGRQYSNHNHYSNYHGGGGPGSISARSRTESHSTTNNYDAFSRTSSRMSLAATGTVEETPQRKSTGGGDRKSVV